MRFRPVPIKEVKHIVSHPEKWRETCDPFSLSYHSFRPTQILGYPHAGNDVFHVKGICEGREIRAYVKAARQNGAAIENEVAILSQLSAPNIPRVIDCDFEERPFSVTTELPGERLSVILGDNKDLASLAYLPEYGRTLAELHRKDIRAEVIKDRRFFRAPTRELLSKLGLERLSGFFAEPPGKGSTCFCHGDFHYANILWKERHISAILDFELAGYGDRDFDIAWALFLRPGQRFLKTDAERRAFLDGYAQLGSYDPEAVRYYMAQCYVYFLEFSADDPEYCAYVRSWLSSLISGSSQN